MPPVAAAFAIVGSSLTGAFAAAGAATAGAVGFGTAAGFAAGFQQIALGLGLSALGQALAPSQSRGRSAPGGMKLTAGSGEATAQSFILGRYVTAGDLVFHGSHGGGGGDRKENYVQVFELSDWPVTGLRRVWINGEWVSLGATATERGYPVDGYSVKGNDRLWVKFYNGTQLAADAELVARFAPPYAQPWTADHIGRGIAYAVVTANYHPKVHTQRPECLFELDGIALYDPRKDSTIGGDGAHRLGNRATWTISHNPAVMIYNILLGIHDPITDEFIWGGQGIAQRDLPTSDWFAAMNECDRLVEGKPNYIAGLEVRVGEEPAGVIEELLKACQGEIAEAAGYWTMVAGPPGLPVYTFSDDDIIITSPDTFEPFPALDAAYNGVRATYPSPGAGWQPKDAPARDRTDYLTADGGRRNIATVQYAAVYDGDQAQRLMKSALQDARRFRRHSLVLPPEARRLGALDPVAWTSARNGYDDKLFRVSMVEDGPGGVVALAMRERNPGDYDWGAGDLLPTDPDFTTKPPRGDGVVDFAVSPASIDDGAGTPRRPAIRLTWSEQDEDVDAIRYRVRLAATHEHLPTIGQAGVTDEEPTTATFALTKGGVAVMKGGVAINYSVFTNVVDGVALISAGLMSDTDYEVQAIYSPTIGRKWSAWLPVTTPLILLGEVDFEQTVRDKIDGAADAANQAAADVLAVLGRVDTVEATVGALSAEVLDAAADLTAALAAYDAAAIANLTGIAVAGLRKGWAADPTFRTWASGAPTNWTEIGVVAYGTLVTGGDTYKGTALRFNVPSGAGVASVSAASDIAGQMIGADPMAEYVVVGALLRGLAGAYAGGRMRAEWKAAGSAVWTRGHAFGNVNSIGRLVEDYGVDVDPARPQSFEVIWQKPFVGAADAVRVYLTAKQETPTTAADLRIDYLDLRQATDGEVKGYLANGIATAEIDALRVEITGPGGSIAAANDVVRAEFGPAVAQVTGGVFALATDLEAQAASLETLSVSFGDPNMVRNSQFADGVRGAGAQPDWWTFWPAGFSVVAGSGAPTQFVAEVAADAAQHQAYAFDRLPVRPGDQIFVGIAAACSGASAAGTISARVEFMTQAGGAPFGAVARTQAITLAQGWVRPVWAAIPVPTGAAEARLIIRRNAGGVGKMLFTQVEARKGDPVAAAEIATIKTTKVDAAGAVAAVQANIGASFGGYSAFVSGTQSAIATADLAASTYVLRATAGAGSAGLRLVAWDDEDGSGGAVVFDAPNVIAPGTISAGELVITDHGLNLVADSDLQAPTYWTGTEAGGEWNIIKDTAVVGADSQGEIRYTGPTVTAANPKISTGNAFPVRPGQVLTCNAQVDRLSGTHYRASAELRFSSRDGAEVITDTIDEVDTTAAGLVDFTEARITVPANMRLCRFRWRLSETNGDVRFFAPSVKRAEKGAILITPESIGGAQLITTEELITNFAQMGNATVGTLTIMDGSLGRLLYGERNTDFTVNIADDWVNVLTFNIPGGMLPAGATAKAVICPSTNVATPPGGGARQIAWRILVDGATVWTSTYDYSNSTDQRSQAFIIPSSIQNGDAIQWQMRKLAGSSGDVRHVKTIMSVINMFQVA